MRKNIETADAFLGRYFPVLDYGFVAMVDYMGGDHAIEQYARTSYGSGTRKTSDTKHLIRYLIRQYHSTPIESTEIAFHLALPIHVARQLVRHRTFSPINEYSGRYSVMPDLFYTPELENFAKQSSNNKQGRSEECYPEDRYNFYMNQVQELRKTSKELYHGMIKDGVAREIARMDLPLSTYTYWYCKMDLNNLFKLLRLRLDNHAQWEIRQYANIMAGLAKTVAPIAFEAFVDYNLCAKSFTRLDALLYNKLCTSILPLTEHKAVNLELKELIEDKMILSLVFEEVKKEIQITNREVNEFWEKLIVPEVPNFDLNLEDSKDSSFFENIIKENSQV